MPLVKYPYKMEKSATLGRVKRPRISIDIFSLVKNDWVSIDEVLADTGADLSVLPRFIGEILVNDITTGKYIEIKGVVPSAVLTSFIHTLKVRVNGKEFVSQIAISDSNAVPSIFGRVDGLDLFNANFSEEKILKLAWKK